MDEQTHIIQIDLKSFHEEIVTQTYGEDFLAHGIGTAVIYHHHITIHNGRRHAITKGFADRDRILGDAARTQPIALAREMIRYFFFGWVGA